MFILNPAPAKKPGSDRLRLRQSCLELLAFSSIQFLSLIKLFKKQIVPVPSGTGTHFVKFVHICF